MNSPAFQVLIPARLGATRLPNKPLADIAGVPMVVRVAQQAAQSNAASVTVAADDAAIVQACQAHKINVVLTDKNHLSGTDRLAEAAKALGFSEDAIVVNVQGDEPLIEPELINAVADTLAKARLTNSACVMSTACVTLDNWQDYQNPNVVKVVQNVQGLASYFSRAPIPFLRAGEQGFAAWANKPLRHIGIYGYQAGFLQTFKNLLPALTELAESLEQLRVLWAGYHIALFKSPWGVTPGVDTVEDLERVRALYAK